jgi:gliding motility-associated-like protein
VIVHEQTAIYIPNAFTPDGDLKNDEFGPMGASLKTFSMTIYSRWGEKIFQSNDIFWNGLTNGKPAPIGVYIYRIDTGTDVIVGRVSVIR